MTLAGFKKLTSDLSKVEMIGFTSLQKIYIRGYIKEESFKINDSDMTVEFDTNDGLHFSFDINDCNSIITNPLGVKYSPQLMP